MKLNVYYSWYAESIVLWILLAYMIACNTAVCSRQYGCTLARGMPDRLIME